MAASPRTCIPQEGDRNFNRTISHNHDNWNKLDMGEVECNIDAITFMEQRCYGTLQKI